MSQEQEAAPALAAPPETDLASLKLDEEELDEENGLNNSDLPSGGQNVVAKLLISNAAAGSIIGKAGQTIEQIQRSSGARVQLSRAGEFYPGTSERVLLLSGSLHSVLTAVFLMLEKLPRDNAPAPMRGVPGSSNGGARMGSKEDTVKMAVSRKLCGAVIGQKGSTIRDFMADSGATIRVQMAAGGGASTPPGALGGGGRSSPQRAARAASATNMPLSELTPSDSERLITISGARDKVLRAAALILNTLSADEKFSAYMDLTLQLASTQGLIPAVRTSTGKSALANAKAQLIMALPDEDVGAVLGKKGQTLTQIQQNAKVAIKISDRAAMDPHTHEREMSIAGTYAAIQLACAMIGEKLAQNKPRASLNSDGLHDDMAYDEEEYM